MAANVSSVLAAGGPIEIRNNFWTYSFSPTLHLEKDGGSVIHHVVLTGLWLVHGLIDILITSTINKIWSKRYRTGEAVKACLREERYFL